MRRHVQSSCWSHTSLESNPTSAISLSFPICKRHHPALPLWTRLGLGGPEPIPARGAKGGATGAPASPGAIVRVNKHPLQVCWEFMVPSSQRLRAGGQGGSGQAGERLHQDPGDCKAPESEVPQLWSANKTVRDTGWAGLRCRGHRWDSRRLGQDRGQVPTTPGARGLAWGAGAGGEAGVSKARAPGQVSAQGGVGWRRR